MSHSQANRWLALVFAVVAVATLAAWQIVERNAIFDDALISFRYARNLAAGDGLVWNRGEPPVEGYTNFLLVAALAPTLRVGLDPLWTTRLWSLLAAGALAGMIGSQASRVGADRATAVLTGTGFLLMSRTAELATVGLETVIFTALLLATFLAGRKAIADLEPRQGLATAALGLLAVLTRPEALLLVALLGLELIGRVRQRRQGSGRTLRVTIAAFALPLGAYLAWKLAYFSSLVPNAFFVKAGSRGWISDRGVESVVGFASDHRLLLLLAALSVLAPGRGRLGGRRTAAWLIALWALFYLRIDTLMDVHGRFLYPLTPFAFYLALPVLVPLLRRLGSWSAGSAARTAFAALVLALLLPLEPLRAARAVADATRGVDRFAEESQAIAKDELSVAAALKGYPEIRSVTIAWGNAGVIPWVTDALFVDMVGLNDAFLARNHDLDARVDYFFSRRADLVILPTDSDGNWFGGHSDLGARLGEWQSDRRWDDYRYVGTLRTARQRDHHYYLRVDSPHAEELSRRLLDGALTVSRESRPPALGSAAGDRRPELPGPS